MKAKIISVVSVLSCLCAGGAHAASGWQYQGSYARDGVYRDDGSRFVVSFRGGASFQSGKINNEVGSLTTEYYVLPDGSSPISAAYYDDCVAAGTACDAYVYAGMGDIADLPAAKNLSAFSFAAGASIGLTIPNSPQWRMEIGWDHIAETEYNATPLFEGGLPLHGGAVDGVVVDVQSGGVQSTISTDIFSAMAFYDFFDGTQKPLQQFIPYVGFGVGYADTTTVLNLADLYGDLSFSVDLQNFGELDQYGVLQFYPSTKNTANVAGLLALGVSYGLAENTFLDMGIRLTYIPKIEWALSNADATRQRDWFSATNVFYTNIMVGLRFEF